MAQSQAFTTNAASPQNTPGFLVAFFVFGSKVDRLCTQPIEKPEPYQVLFPDVWILKCGN
jgi:hypothetical protein